MIKTIDKFDALNPKSKKEKFIVWYTKKILSLTMDVIKKSSNDSPHDYSETLDAIFIATFANMGNIFNILCHSIDDKKNIPNFISDSEELFKKYIDELKKDFGVVQ